LVSDMDSALSWFGKLAQPVTPTPTLLLLATFIGLGLAPMVAVVAFHRRGIGTLWGQAPVVLSDFTICAATVGLVYGGGIAVWSWFYDTVPNIELWLWLSYLPLALLGVAVQTAAEELLFRGYLMQQLAARFRHPVIWLLIPALIFGAAHYDPTSAGPNTWLLVGSATLFGLIAADLTVVSGSLGAAWGVHFANNVVAILVLATQGTITGLALRLTPYDIDAAQVSAGAVLTDLALILLVWLLLRRHFVMRQARG
ncbi:hypothetical protein LCGC14_2920180, partial [marine sediment metagenome]